MGGILRQQQLGHPGNIGMSSYIYPDISRAEKLTEFIARARTYNVRVSKDTVREQHVLTRYGPREFCGLIGQLNWGSGE